MIEGPCSFRWARHRVRVDDRVLVAPRIFINVGGRAIVPPLPGIATGGSLTNTSMLALDQVPEYRSSSAAAILVSSSHRLRRFGADVTVVERLPRLVGREDEDVSNAIKDIFDAKASRSAPVPSASAWRARARRVGRCGLHRR